jgi:hypothetical protein
MGEPEFRTHMSSVKQTIVSVNLQVRMEMSRMANTGSHSLLEETHRVALRGMG